MFSRPEVSVLLVCTANICRSPMAHGLLAQFCAVQGLGKRVEVQSAGTHVGVKGQRPDPRAQAVMSRVGIDISRIRSQAFDDRDFEVFDHILVMSRQQLKSLTERAPEAPHAQLHLIMDFARKCPEAEVPDPYYGNPAGFELVFSLLEEATQGIVEELLLPRLTMQGM